MAAIWLVPGCGGGSNGGTGGVAVSTPRNQPPVFTSAATASVAENTADAYQAAATDANGDAITFSVTGGADASLFTISATGLLRFTTAPDFDLPGDADGDNVYQISLSASDGKAQTTRDLSITVTNDREGIAVHRIGSGLADPVALAAVPGGTTLYVAQRDGTIFTLDTRDSTKGTYIKIPVGSGGDRGLINIAVAPDPGRSVSPDTLLVMYSDAAGTIQIASIDQRFLAIGSGAQAIRQLYRIPHPDRDTDYGGWIAYGPDNRYWIATGDGGGRNDPDATAQDRGGLLGKILRLRLSTADPYAGAAVPSYIPAFEPAPDNPDPTSPVVATGLHNPRAASFTGGHLLIADRGQDRVEEIDDLPVGASTNRNFGWPFEEGSLPVGAEAPPGLVRPVTEYAHGTGPREGTSIVGGYAYRGKIASLAGQYVFADRAGSIWAVPVAKLLSNAPVPATAYAVRTADFAPDAGTLAHPVAITEGSDGTLYIVDAGGDVFRVDAAG